MKSILLCEGKTDADFLQYYMRKVHQWEDGRPAEFKPTGYTFGCILTKDSNELYIIALNGCGDIINGVKEIFDFNIQNRPDDIFKKIVFVTDNDDEDTIVDRISSVIDIIIDMNLRCEDNLVNAKWTGLRYQNSTGEELYSSIIPMIIPFGANDNCKKRKK